MAAKKTISVLILILILLALLAGGYFLWAQSQSGESGDTTQIDTAEETVSDAAGASSDNPAAQDANDESVSVVTTIDAKAALKERVLGNPNAPVKISEHSSFTCGHCGNFHRTVFAQFKKEWIDTGRAYLVFSDFPLNAPALHASVIARCLPDDRYFSFTDMLFEMQDDWAYKVTYLDFLKAEANKNGLSGDAFTTCLQNEDIQKGILDRVRATQSQWDINSTPSFVVNNETVITGSLSYDAFNAAIEDALKKQAGGTDAEGTPPAPAPSADAEQVPEGVPAAE